MRKRNWNTYAIRPYGYDVANNQKSAGGIHCFQIRKTSSGWQRRIKQVNGIHVSYGGAVGISDTDGEDSFALSKIRQLKQK